MSLEKLSRLKALDKLCTWEDWEWEKKSLDVKVWNVVYLSEKQVDWILVGIDPHSANPWPIKPAKTIQPNLERF